MSKRGAFALYLCGLRAAYMMEVGGHDNEDSSSQPPWPLPIHCDFGPLQGARPPRQTQSKVTKPEGLAPDWSADQPVGSDGSLPRWQPKANGAAPTPAQTPAQTPSWHTGVYETNPFGQSSGAPMPAPSVAEAANVGKTPTKQDAPIKGMSCADLGGSTCVFLEGGPDVDTTCRSIAHSLGSAREGLWSVCLKAASGSTGVNRGGHFGRIKLCAHRPLCCGSLSRPSQPPPVATSVLCCNSAPPSPPHPPRPKAEKARG